MSQADLKVECLALRQRLDAGTSRYWWFARRSCVTLGWLYHLCQPLLAASILIATLALTLVALMLHPGVHGFWQVNRMWPALLSSIPSAWLVWRASSRTMQSAAKLAFYVWANSFCLDIYWLRFYSRDTNRQRSALFQETAWSYYACVFFVYAAVLQTMVVVNDRATALKKSLLRKRSTNIWALKWSWVTVATAGFLIICVDIVGNFSGIAVAGVLGNFVLVMTLMWFALASRPYWQAGQIGRNIRKKINRNGKDQTNLLEEVDMSMQAVYVQYTGLVLVFAILWLRLFFHFLRIDIMWPFYWPFSSDLIVFLDRLVGGLESTISSFSALLVTGTSVQVFLHMAELQKAATTQYARRHARILRHMLARRYWLADASEEWNSKVEELAFRGFTLESLLSFYKGLGVEYMQHFNPDVHTTNDVVRQAIIPLTAKSKTSMAEVMMNGKPTLAKNMVTHAWSNRFRDLVVSVIAHALEETEFEMLASLIDKDFAQVEAWVDASGRSQETFWLCVFSVNQHASICDNPYGACDPVLGTEHPACQCNMQKQLNESAPLRDGKSCLCEMNKFDDVMKTLALSSKGFAQIVAVDADCRLFNRAWCVSELATAHRLGVKQHLKIQSGKIFRSMDRELRNLKIQDMTASRQEDVDEILAAIPDHDAFNASLQSLLFDDLLPSWIGLDALQQISRAGRFLRWQHVEAVADDQEHI